MGKQKGSRWGRESKRAAGWGIRKQKRQLLGGEKAKEDGCWGMKNGELVRM